MPADHNSWRPFLVLLACDSTIEGRALRSVLETSGYDVLATTSGRESIDFARARAPDAILLAMELDDVPGVEVCRRLSGDPDLSPATPILLFASHGTSRAQRLESYGCGAWDVCSHPLDGAALLLRMQTYLRAKQAVDRYRDESFVDPSTGLYNTRGLQWRAREIAADAARRREPLACIAFAPMRAGRADTEPGLALRVAERCRRMARGSDVVGRIGGEEFALIAPHTDAAGAVRLIDRFQERDGDQSPGIEIRAGFCATANYADFPLAPIEMVQRAASSLREAGTAHARARLDGDDASPAPDSF